MSLASKAVLGAIWTVSTSVGGRLLGLVGTLILTRFLAPAEYGAVSVAIVVVTTANFLSSAGFGQYVVANPAAGPDVVFHATVYHLGSGLVAFAAVFLGQEIIASIFEMPSLVAYIPTLLVAVVIDRFGYLPTRVLARDMRFDVLGIIQLAGEVVYAVTAVGLAWKGFGAHAVMWAYFARMTVQAGIALLKVARRDWLTPTKLNRQTTRELMDFGLPMAGANALHFLSGKGDNLIIAGMFGPAAVGFYNFAYNIANIPATHVGEHIGDVLLPSFAKLESMADKHKALVRASGLLALVVFPLALGLGAVAHQVVGVLLDDRWAPVAPMLLILSALSVFRPVGWLVQSYLQAMKRTRTLLIVEIIKVGALFLLIYTLGRAGGVLWACGAIGIAFLVFAFACQWVVYRVDGLGMWTMTKPYVRPLLACAPMVGAVVGARMLVGRYVWWALLVEIAVGAVAYLIAAFVIAGPQARDFTNLVMNVVRRRRGGPPSEPGAAASAGEA
ncbi:MAG: oligosaccharide flippase family protein, partial [Polyangiaceae bacterium]